MIDRMDIYIVRLYQRNPEDLMGMAGIVELVEKQQRKPFRGYEELWKIMASDYEEKKAAVQKSK